MRTQIESNFEINIGRVENLIKIYRDNFQGTGGGRRGAQKTDILRAATVFLHASLEDFLRTLMIWKYPECSEDIFKIIPLKGTGQNKNATKFWLSDIAKYRGETIDQILKDSVKEYANTYSFNRTSEINAILDNCKIICTEEISNTYSVLDKMISRRHNIVHQADKDDRPGRGNHNIKSIGIRTVEKWLNYVKKFETEVIDCIDNATTTCN